MNGSDSERHLGHMIGRLESLTGHNYPNRSQAKNSVLSSNRRPHATNMTSFALFPCFLHHQQVKVYDAAPVISVLIGFSYYRIL